MKPGIMNLVAAAGLSVSLTPGLATAQAAVEFDSGSGGTSATPPTEGPVSFDFRNNSNNPSGNAFQNVTAPTPSVTFEIVDQAVANGTNFTSDGAMIGGTFNGDPHLSVMDFFGGGEDGYYTSLPAHAASTGIDVNTNYAVLMEMRTGGLAAAGTPATGRFRVADLDISFSHPVSNPVLHLQALGGLSGGKSFAGGFELIQGASNGATGLQQLSSNGSLVTSGSDVDHNGTGGFGTNCNGSPSAACGSVEVTGDAVRSVRLRMYLASNDAQNWPANGAEGIFIGVSGEISDMTSNFANVPGTVFPGQTYSGLQATCNNSGPNTSRGAFCDLFASEGQVSDIICDAPDTDVPPGADVTCTFDYAPPLAGSGVSTVTFDSRTGAFNDRVGGDVGTAGNNPGGASSVVFDDTVTALS